METVNLSLIEEIDSSYDISIDKALLSKIPSDLIKNHLGNKYLIITDSNVKDLFGTKLLSMMKKSGLNTEMICFEAGEQSKNLKVFGNLLDKAFSFGLDRKSAIIALGGGVTGDIAGFVAATYMRGIAYVQVPTTLLAAVDSSIGGKVAVDLPNGKNIVGNFHQPNKVYIDVSVLKTLSEKEMANGMAEVIKHAMIRDIELFNFIDGNLKKIMRKDEKILIQLIKTNCQIKSAVVEQDEKERGLRKLLNYGHTIGHALEALTNYKKYSHGEAVSIGMAVEGLISNKIGMLSKQELTMQNDLLKRIGLPIKLPNLNADKIVDALKKDKKSVDGRIEFVLLEKIGKARYGINVPNKIIKEAIEEST